MTELMERPEPEQEYEAIETTSSRRPMSPTTPSYEMSSPNESNNITDSSVLPDFEAYED
jgi:hypothetical protein